MPVLYHAKTGATKTMYRNTRGPNGPDIAHLGILPQSVKIHLVVIEILSFSCSVLLLVNADGDHFAVPNCKKKIKMA